MAEKFKGKYRIGSTRLQDWDYRWKGAYFITFCTKNRAHYFGEIENGEMNLSPIGAIADILWYEIKNHSKGLELGAFVVMPNHIHGVIILEGEADSVEGGRNPGNLVGNPGNLRGNPGNLVEAGHALLQPDFPDFPDLPNQPNLSNQPDQTNSSPQTIGLPQTIGQQRFQNIGKNSISSLIGSYKSAVTKHAHRLGYDFIWQPLFYDHIIRNNQAFKNIQSYIEQNPKNWKEDKRPNTSL